MTQFIFKKFHIFNLSQDSFENGVDDQDEPDEQDEESPCGSLNGSSVEVPEVIVVDSEENKN